MLIAAKKVSADEDEQDRFNQVLQFWLGAFTSAIENLFFHFSKLEFSNHLVDVT
jgi:hypothetical protein